MSTVRRRFFLVGAERSGTTMLRLMLNSHPRLAWQNEFEFAVDRVSDQGEWPDLREYWRWLEIHRIFQASRFAIDKDLNYPELVNSFLDQKLAVAGKDIVGATVHRNFHRLLSLWPHAAFIHFIRDGRDVAFSNIGMGWAGNVYTGAKRWLEAEKLWESVMDRLSSDQYIEVKYEALLENPEQELAKIADFIGVAYSPEMLEYHTSTTYSLPDKKHIQSWKKKLSKRQVQLVESRLAPLLLARGYELSGYPERHPGYLSRKWLFLQDRLYRFRYRLRKYGPLLLFSDIVSRRLNLIAWQRSVKARLNHVDASLLK